MLETYLDKMMTETFAVVDEAGRVISTTKVPVLTIKPGQRVSYRSGEISTNRTNGRGMGTIEHFHQDGCEGLLYNYNDGHYFTVIGDNPESVNDMIHYIQHILGAKDVPVPRRLLPDLKSFGKRLKFLFWDYLVHGFIESK